MSRIRLVRHITDHFRQPSVLASASGNQAVEHIAVHTLGCFEGFLNGPVLC
jgi:hypothetical protein